MGNFASADNALQALLKRARLTLIDTGTRNRLIHCPGSGRGKAIEINDEISDCVLELLLRNGRKMSFIAGKAEETEANGLESDDQSDDKPSADVPLALPAPDSNGGIGEARTDTKLQTRLSPETLQRKLLTLYRDTKSLVEEQGVNVLYLALGFLEWYEAPASEVPRLAPLILLPVELVRDNVRSAFKLAIREEDLSANVALEERLRENFGITLPQLPETEEWQPSMYFRRVLEAVQSQPRWRIRENRIVLGFFSFTKLIMYRDLDAPAWPNDSLLQHPLLRALLGVDGFPDEESLFPEDAKLDQFLDPKDLIHVVDADGSQSLVIEALRRGRNLVVQGPPGTGKSQTITNIIATAVREGKSVLFVAEKLAALQVVHSRLQRVGLSPICLELHSRNANKRAVVEELGRTLNMRPPSLDESNLLDELRSVRDQLNACTTLLHTPVGRSGMTPYDAIGAQFFLTEAGYPPPDLDLPQAARWSPDEANRVATASERYAHLIKEVGLPGEHSWRGVTALTLQPGDLQRLANRLPAAITACRQLVTSASAGARYLGLPEDLSFADIERTMAAFKWLAERPNGIATAVPVLLACSEPTRLAECVAEYIKFDEEVAELSNWFTEEAWTIDADGLRNDLAEKGDSFFGRLGGTYRNARRDFRAISKPPQIEELDECIHRLDRLIVLRKLLAKLDAESQFLASNLGSIWKAEQTDYGLVSAALQWLGKVTVHRSICSTGVLSDARYTSTTYHQIAAGIACKLEDANTRASECLDFMKLDSKTAFGVIDWNLVTPSAMADRFSEWLADVSQYYGWVHLVTARQLLQDCGGPPLAEALSKGSLPPGRAASEFVYCRAEQVWKAAVESNPELVLIEGEARKRLVGEFQTLETKRRELAVREVLNRHGSAMPRGTVGEMGIVRGEIARKRGHLPVRKLMARAGTVIQKIKPVMLMSPLSVAQFLPPGAAEFDFLVIDEASQVKPEDALGAILRCKHMAVIGDQRQLPPTSFFDRLVYDESDPDEDIVAQAGLANTGDMESILTLCEARGVPRRMLRWHYRSRHPSLIEVSNAEFYDNDLFLPPAPVYDRGKTGFHVRRVAGAYDRGGKRTNRIEADSIIRAVKQHARSTPDQSLGIVTFSITQKQLIEDLLEAERRIDSELERFTSRPDREPLFVKNLENVQGDERDTIFVSVGYGPRQQGMALDSMAFGPVSAEGGERRLNVLFSRARYRCEVFVSFGSTDIDLNRTTQLGPKVLKKFLKFGETGSMDLPLAAGGFDSPFEEAVAATIRSFGYEVDSQVGSAGFRIDLAVKNPLKPGSYLIAIECDGASYHSARWARERDRLRQEILEAQGWQFHRIWSTDWFKRPAIEKAKLKTTIESAISSQPAIQTDVTVDRDPGAELHEVLVSTPENPDVTPYKEASFSINKSVEPHDIPKRELASIVTKIVEIEGPIHQDEIARRVARLCGKDRCGVRISAAVLDGVRLAESTRSIVSEGPFWSLIGAHSESIRNRVAAPLNLKRGEMLPPQEIRQAALIAFRQNGPMSKGELITAIARLFGFERTGLDIRASISDIVQSLIDSGMFVCQGQLVEPSVGPESQLDRVSANPEMARTNDRGKPTLIVANDL